jgi:ABC-type nitrate/sulfonate/bicarbonate transport system ATPase subunit
VRVKVLDRISLEVLQGEFVSIVGPSGCGKSTLLRLIAGLDPGHEGQIWLDGELVTSPGLERGIVFQEHRLFPWLTAEENVRLALENSQLTRHDLSLRVQEHLELVGLKGFEQAYPYQLSGGMSQRVAIARSLVNRPKILLLDEPFGALDALTRSKLQEELHRIWRIENITTILVTQDVQEAVSLSQRVIIMEPHPGRIKKTVSISSQSSKDDLRRQILDELLDLRPERPIHAPPRLSNRANQDTGVSR